MPLANRARQAKGCTTDILPTSQTHCACKALIVCRCCAGIDTTSPTNCLLTAHNLGTMCLQHDTHKTKRTTRLPCCFSWQHSSTAALALQLCAAGCMTAPAASTYTPGTKYRLLHAAAVASCSTVQLMPGACINKVHGCHLRC